MGSEKDVFGSFAYGFELSRLLIKYQLCHAVDRGKQ